MPEFVPMVFVVLEIAGGTQPLPPLSPHLSQKHVGMVIFNVQVKIAHSFLHVMCDCSNLSSSACMGSSTCNRKRISRNPLLTVNC